jgi:hypothetical protein
MSNGKVIVFDYARAHLRWSRFTVKNGSETPVDIAVLGDTPYVLTSGGKLYYMGTSAVDDDGTFVTASLTTGWMRPAGSLGEARFRILHLYGNRDTHSGVTETITTQGGEPQAAAPTSQAVTWTGTEMSKGGTPAHVRHRIKYQRGYAIRLTLTQVAGDAVDSGGFEPLMVGFEYGTHNRVGKTAATSNPG